MSLFVSVCCFFLPKGLKIRSIFLTVTGELDLKKKNQEPGPKGVVQHTSFQMKTHIESLESEGTKKPPPQGNSFPY